MKPVLLRIPFSHFCRKAEWGLTQAGIAYDTLDVKLTQMPRVAEVTSAGTVPVLRVGDRLLGDSHDILVWADEHRCADAQPLYPEGAMMAVAAWEEWAGRELGPATRREAYRAVHASWRAYWGYPEMPWYLRSPLASRYALGVLKFYKARRFEQQDPLTIHAALQRVAAQLRESGGPWLFGAHPTAADVATAALLEPLLPVAAARRYEEEPAWQVAQDLVQRARPRRTLRRRSRPVRDADWRQWSALGRAGLSSHGAEGLDVAGADETAEPR